MTSTNSESTTYILGWYIMTRRNTEVCRGRLLHILAYTRCITRIFRHQHQRTRDNENMSCYPVFFDLTFAPHWQFLSVTPKRYICSLDHTCKWCGRPISSEIINCILTPPTPNHGSTSYLSPDNAVVTSVISSITCITRLASRRTRRSGNHLSPPSVSRSQQFVDRLPEQHRIFHTSRWDFFACHYS